MARGIGGGGALRWEGVVDQMTASAPRVPQLKGERRVFGLRHAGSAVLFKQHTLEQSVADQISVADQVSQQVVGSHRLNILTHKYCWY